MSAGQHTSNAHGVLQYLITRALLQGKLGTSTVQIPMVDLFDQYEGLDFTDEAAQLVLNIKITTSWDEESLDTEIIQELDAANEAEDNEEEDGHGQ